MNISKVSFGSLFCSWRRCGMVAHVGLTWHGGTGEGSVVRVAFFTMSSCARGQWSFVFNEPHNSMVI